MINLIAALFAVLLYLGGLSYKLIGTVLVITIPTIIILLVVAIQPNQPFLKDYQQERILAWLEPEKYADDESYQQLNSVMAIGSGQLTGKGYDNDATTSVKNGNFGVNVAELCRQTHGAVEIEYFFALFVLLVNRQQNENSVGDYLSVQMMILFGALENGEAVVDRVSKTGRVIDLNEVRDKSC